MYFGATVPFKPTPFMANAPNIFLHSNLFLWVEDVPRLTFLCSTLHTRYELHLKTGMLKYPTYQSSLFFPSCDTVLQCDMQQYEPMEYILNDDYPKYINSRLPETLTKQNHGQNSSAIPSLKCCQPNHIVFCHDNAKLILHRFLNLVTLNFSCTSFNPLAVDVEIPDSDEDVDLGLRRLK